MNRDKISELLCEWRWSDKSVDSVIDKIKPLFEEEQELKKNEI